MEVYLLRHGRAADVIPDSARPLTTRGRLQLESVGTAMKKLGIKPEIMAASPLLRAQQTASIIREYLDVPSIQTWESLLPSAPPIQTLEDMRASGASPVLLVGHQPHMSALVSVMTGASAHLKKAGLAYMTGGTLRYLLTPRQLEMIS